MINSTEQFKGDRKERNLHVRKLLASGMAGLALAACGTSSAEVQAPTENVSEDMKDTTESPTESVDDSAQSTAEWSESEDVESTAEATHERENILESLLATPEELASMSEQEVKDLITIKASDYDSPKEVVEAFYLSVSTLANIGQTLEEFEPYSDDPTGFASDQVDKYYSYWDALVRPTEDFEGGDIPGQDHLWLEHGENLQLTRGVFFRGGSEPFLSIIQVSDIDIHEENSRLVAASVTIERKSTFEDADENGHSIADYYSENFIDTPEQLTAPSSFHIVLKEHDGTWKAAIIQPLQ